MKIPFFLPVGHVLKYGGRRMRFEEELGDGILRFRYVDGDQENVLVPVGRGGGLGMPTVVWMIEQFRAGRVVDPDFGDNVGPRREDLLGLDRPACIAIDPLSGWRFDWADATLGAAIKKTEESVKAFIAKNDFGGRKPSPRSLLRWMRTLKLAGGRIGALVSTAGREKGQSQLSDVEDRLVHKWAIRYWRPSSLNGRLAHKEDATALMVAEWDELKEMGIPFMADEPPCAETMRRRINSLHCRSTHASRYGTPAADRLFSPSDEPVEASTPFERIYMDGVEWEHAVHYSEEMRIPAAKMRSVIAMCAFSQFVFPHPTFAGAFRPQMGMAALRNVMLPPPMTEDEIAADPEAALFYSLPSDVVYDRDRTMLSPRMVPGAIKLFSTAELLEAYHSDGKSKLENYNKYVKQSLSKVRGRILGPRIKYEIGYDPLAHAESSRTQYIDMVEQCRKHWNRTQKTSLGNRSPNDIMRAFIASGAVKLTDPNEVARTFASTPTKKMVLTTNGLTYDNVHYRFNRDGVGKALSSNHRNVPFGERLTGTAKILVSIRVWDDDIDFIEVYDEENREYFRMWSTDPGYTGGLTRWEHQIYQKALRSAGGRTKRNAQRERAKFLNERQRTLTGKSFRERAADVELLEAEERRLSGRRGLNFDCATVPELGIRTHIDGAGREDLPMPPPQKRDPAPAFDTPDGADDRRSDPSRKVSEDLGDADAVVRPSWNFKDATAEDDEEDE